MPGPLFVLSSGRSGSTLLQRVLNSYDHITVWGEHAGFLAPLAESYYRLLENPGSNEYLFPGTEGRPLESLAALAERKDPRHWQAWTNFISRTDVTDFFRRHVESFFRHPVMGDGHVWGFKEIRYGRGDRVIEMLHALYPGATFVFLCRDALSTLASQRHTFHGTTGFGKLVPTPPFVSACRDWKTQNETLRRWHLSGRLNSYWFKFEDLVAREGEALRPLFDALGLEYTARQRNVFAMDEGRGSMQPAEGVVHRWRSLGWLPRLMAQSIVGKLNAALGYQPASRFGVSRSSAQQTDASAAPRESAAHAEPGNGEADRGEINRGETSCLQTITAAPPATPHPS